MCRDHVQFGGLSMHPAEIAAQAAAEDNAACAATLRRYEARLARALAAVINIRDPDAPSCSAADCPLDRLYASVPKLWTRPMHVLRQPCQPPPEEPPPWRRFRRARCGLAMGLSAPARHAQIETG